MNKIMKMGLGIFVLLVLLFGVLWFFFFKEEEVTSLEFSYSERLDNPFSISNTLPINDSVGKRLLQNKDEDGVQNYLDFEVKNSSLSSNRVKYEIYVVDLETNQTINPNYIKIYLTNGSKEETFSSQSDSKVPTYRDLRVASSEISGKRLYVGTIGKGQTQQFRVRIWLADTYVITSDIRHFSMEVRVKAMS